MHITCTLLLCCEMVSRKKAKGKERRAAKAKADEDQEEAQEQKALEAQMQRLTMDELFGKSDAVQNCHHGLDVESHEGKLCREFITEFHKECSTKFNSGENCMVTCFEAGTKATKAGKFTAMWNDATKLTNIALHCVEYSTECILDGNDHQARKAASFAYFFEQQIAVYFEKTKPAVNWHGLAELHHGDLHTLVKFLRKRIPCKCLDEKYNEVKSVTKIGICCNTKCSHRRVAQREMFCCDGCRFVCYCSPGCQKVDWPRHKEECKELARERAEFAAKQRLLQQK